MDSIAKSIGTNVPSFSHLWHEAIAVVYPSLEKNVKKAKRGVAGVRRDAYRFAKLVRLMIDHHYNALVDQIHTNSQSFRDWMDAHFEIIESMNETRERIFAAIETGVTEEQYVAEGELAIVTRRLKDKTAHVDDPIVERDTAPMTVEERLAHFKDLCESYKSKWQGERSRRRQLAQDLARVMVRLKKVERDLEKAKKYIDDAVSIET